MIEEHYEAVLLCRNSSEACGGYDFKMFWKKLA
jgi:hypothetical protein